MARKPSRAAAGYIRKLPSGRYQASHVYNSVRYFAATTYTAKVDADAWLRARLTDVERGEWSPVIAEENATAKAEAARSLAEYAQTWMGGKPRRPRTVDEYRRLLAGPLADLAALPLPKITTTKVDAWWAAQLTTGKLTQASRAYSLLNTVMRYALSRGHLIVNPCRVDGGQSLRTKRKVVPPTDEQLATILATIASEYCALVHLAAEGGLRYGEATDLHRSDVDVQLDDDGAVERVLVSVSHAVTRTSSGYQSGPPKSEAGVRSVYVYGAAAAAIAEHLKSHVARFGDPLLFPAGRGDGWLAQSSFTKHWYPAREAAGRPDMPFHALRHRAGTVYVQHGATMQEAMTRLGHSSTAVAMRYQHATGRDAKIAARMAGKTSA